MKKSFRMLSLIFAMAFCCCCTSLFAHKRYICPSSYSTREQFEQALKSELQFALREINELRYRREHRYQDTYRMQSSSTIRNILKCCFEECRELEIEEHSPLAPGQYGVLPFKFEYKAGQNCVTSWGW